MKMFVSNLSLNSVRIYKKNKKLEAKLDLCL